jgi:hypothetical protein
MCNACNKSEYIVSLAWRKQYTREPKKKTKKQPEKIVVHNPRESLIHVTIGTNPKAKKSRQKRVQGERLTRIDHASLLGRMGSEEWVNDFLGNAGQEMTESEMVYWV